MKRIVMALFVLVALSGMNSAAQEGNVVDVITLDASEIGDGWTLTHTESFDLWPREWERHDQYGGPAGSRITVWSTSLGANLGQVAMQWDIQEQYWTYIVAEQLGIESPTSELIETGTLTQMFPGIVTDAKGVEDVPEGSFGKAVSLYGSYDLRIGVIILVEGTVNDLTGVAAADYVAGLYFAALSAE